jgi:hypothetical protein
VGAQVGSLHIQDMSRKGNLRKNLTPKQQILNAKRQEVYFLQRFGQNLDEICTH